MQFRDFIKLALASAVGVAALQPVTAVAQETRSEISVQGTGFFTKDSDGNGVQDHVTSTGGFLIGFVTTSIVGLPPRPITAMTGIRRPTLAADQGVCSPTFTKSPAKLW